MCAHTSAHTVRIVRIFTFMSTHTDYLAGATVDKSEFLNACAGVTIFENIAAILGMYVVRPEQGPASPLW